MANCQEIRSLSSSEGRSYSACNSYSVKDYYGRIFVRFSMPDFNFDQFTADVDRATRRNLLRRVSSFFLPHTREGSLVARFVLQRGNGLPDVTIGIVELAKFNMSDSKGIVITRSGESLDGFYGPTFLADGNTQVRVETTYIFKRVQSSRISSLIGSASRLLSGQGFLGGKVKVSDEAQQALVDVEKEIVASFNTTATFANPIQVSYDVESTSGIYRRVTFNGVLTAPGQLYVGAIRIPSVLVDLPEAGVPAIYTTGGYDITATNPILNRTIQATTLRDYVAKQMGAQVSQLARSDDAAHFRAADSALETVLTDTTLRLVSEDQLAAQWAFTARNPLLADPQVRAGYSLRSAETGGALARLRLDLPPVATVLPDGAKALVAASQAAADLAAAAQQEAQTALTRAAEASGKSMLPVTPTGVERWSDPSWVYDGETRTAGGRFYGHLLAPRLKAEYLGSLVLSGTTPIYEGAGRYTPVTGTAPFRDYTGQFVANWFSGHGVMRWPDGREYYGQFAQDQPSGFGVLFAAGGVRYYASYAGGQPTGTVVRRKGDGTLDLGRWVGDQFVAE
jgi:hypothetical protein